ncbi:MAG: hypothetical protein EA353_14130 [Puniceicoccaceae bacterium]|nr:MAG: hypothetical protein EA353_14130 [Puniceicoccaceae bacterium]
MIPTKYPLLGSLVLVFACGFLSHASAATYHVKNGGNNNLNGLSDANAWATLQKVNNVNFQPGDRIRFKRGSAWGHVLRPSGNGTAGNRIVLDAYGSGGMPRVDPGNEATNTAAAISNQSGYTFRNLEFRRALRGLTATATTQNVNAILVDNCRFQDLNYAAVGDNPGHGLTIAGSRQMTDIRAENNTAVRVTRAFVIEQASGAPGLHSLLVTGNTSQNGKSGSFFLGRAMSGSAQNNSCLSTTGSSGVWFGVAGGRIQNSPGYMVKFASFNSIRRNGAPDGCGFDFEGNSNNTLLHTSTSNNTDGPGVIVLQTGGANINLRITDVDISDPARNPKNSNQNYSFWVSNTASNGTVNRGVWRKGQAAAVRSPNAATNKWVYNGTSFLP